MRWIRDIVLLLVLASIAAAIVWYQYENHEHAAAFQKTTADTQRLEREVRFRAATKTGPLNWRGWPITVDSSWFEKDPPVNAIVDAGHPWVEVAAEDEAGLLHPRQRLALDPTTAGFWYNPYQGVVRARIPVQVSDTQATEMYNAINQCNIPSIAWMEKPMDVPKPKTDKAAADGDKKDDSATPNASAAMATQKLPMIVVRPEKKP